MHFVQCANKLVTSVPIVVTYKYIHVYKVDLKVVCTLQVGDYNFIEIIQYLLLMSHDTIIKIL